MGSTGSLAHQAGPGAVGPVPRPREPADEAVRPVPAARRVHPGADAVEDQLRKVEQRLVGEAAGDPVAVLAVRDHLAAARARFGDARVRQFLPILVEREVRRRLREDAGPG